jgi:glycosyltransferase involved in cell wall biosynthesis
MQELLGSTASGMRTVLLPNPIDGTEIRRLAGSGEPRNEERMRFVAIGRLASQKGYDVLVRALGRASTELPEWELVILGDGPERPSLERLAAETGVGGRVEFRGYVDSPYAALASADVFVHAARWEGFGLVIAEALTLGVPVIATSCPGGPREILGDGRYGVLVEPDDPQGLAHALLALADDPAERSRLAVAGPARAAEYAPERVAERVLAICSSMQ